MELRAYLSYTRKKPPLRYWRSKNGHEVDFLIGETTAIEVKASRKVSRNDFKDHRNALVFMSMVRGVSPLSGKKVRLLGSILNNLIRG